MAREREIELEVQEGTMTIVRRGSELISLSFEADSESSPVDPPEPTPGVTEFSDGPHGNVWKQSDHHAGAVVLFHPDYDRKFNSVVAYNKKGKRLEEFFFTGWANPHLGKDRQHWRCNRPTRRFPKVVFLRCDDLTFRIEDAKGRVD